MNNINNVTYSTCSDGLIVPVFGTKWYHAIAYLFALFYCFLGIAIIADLFMCSIERITSVTKLVRKKRNRLMSKEAGSDEFESVRVWNPTVANLTLMALGSSAPEILLSCIEIVANGFRAGQLGPGTIVGSAAFNMFCIPAICVMCIGIDAKRISNYRVFAVTSIFSIFAYLWLFLVLVIITPNRIDLWEAALTFAMFPILVYFAYRADIKNGKTECDSIPTDNELKQLTRGLSCELTDQDKAEIIAERTLPHSRLYYRIQAIRLFTSSTRKITDVDECDEKMQKSTIVEFSARSYCFQTNSVEIKIIKKGNVRRPVCAEIITKNGSAVKDTHYYFKKETIQIAENEQEKIVQLNIVNIEDEWADDHVFYVHLRLKEESEEVKLGNCSITRIRKCQINNSPFVEFSKPNYIVKENIGYCRVFLKFIGNRNESIGIKYKTCDISAKDGYDYMGTKDYSICIFDKQELEKYIDIQILDDKEDEKDEHFLIELIEADGVKIGKVRQTTVTIISDDSTIRSIRNIRNLLKSTHFLTPDDSWKTYIVNSITVNSGDIENATIGDCIKHSLAFFWKCLFSIVPPAFIMNGYPCFIISLVFIGLLTAIVGDLASIFGCLIGISDSITAITLVALGTSLPDTFASKIAAQADNDADNAIGNVTGSNCVNVFLGLGLPWLLASIYWQIKGQVFHIEAGNLGFSVTVYLICSIIFLSILSIRRYSSLSGRGELGGPLGFKLFTFCAFIGLWISYILLSIWNIYY